MKNTPDGENFVKPCHTFFICRHCGNMVGAIFSKGAPMVCCGENMAELAPNTVEASAEKHIPAVTVTDSSINVTVGSVAHPMEEVHHIEFVYVETERGGQRKRLKVGEKPVLSFSFTEDKPLAVYAYCNLHGLWKAEV
jgi:superoxide reductase